MTYINTRADLDALIGTTEHGEFMTALAGTIYRIEKDDELQAWQAVQDTSQIEQYGFTLADFPEATPPEFPVYAPPTKPKVIVTPRQIRQALTQLGLRTAVEAAVVEGSQNLKDWWEFSTAFDRNHPEVIAMGATLEVSDTELDELFATAAGL